MNSRFAVAVHTLTVLAHHGDRSVSSDLIAASVNTNPVVIRRLIGWLRHAGLVATQAGRGGGFTLARDPKDISLLDIYRAIDDGELIPIREDANCDCAVGRELSGVLQPYCAGAKRAMEAYFRGITLQEIVRKVERRIPKRDVAARRGRAAAPHRSRARSAPRQ